MYFDSRDTFCKQPFGAVETGKRVTLRLKLDKEPAPKNVRLFMYCVHTGSGEYRKMKLCGETQTENIYSVSFLAPKPALYRYGFEYESNGEKKYIPLKILCGMITAGGIGNLIDRVRLNYVVDFIYFSLIDFPVFNVADIYVTTSMILLLILVFFYYKDEDFQFLKWKREK